MDNAKVYQMVTDQIIRLLETGTVPWRQPWSATGGIPRNLVSGKPYRGINPLLLLATGQNSPYWMTFKQVNSLGGRVRKGERGTCVTFWKMRKVTQEQEDGTTVTEQIPLLRHYKVWNLNQTTDVKLPKWAEEEMANAAASTVTAQDRIAAAEKIILGYVERGGPELAEDGGNRAFYRPAADSIHLPKRETFENLHEFYSTAFHEMTHSTGHSSRLNRHTSGDQMVFGSHSYGREELVAEMGAAFLCAEADILPVTVDNTAAYLRGWIDAVREDPGAVVVAAGKAQRAADYILGREVVRQGGDGED